MINICTTSCCVRYVVCSVTVKIITNLDTGDNYKDKNWKSLRDVDHK